MKNIIERHIKYKKNKNLYMLCASAYGANDFYKIKRYINKIYKWGYFPETRLYDIKTFINKKFDYDKKIKIIWAGRFLKCKHPEQVIKLAKKLKKDNYNFEIQMLGNGKLFEKIKRKINKLNLQKNIKLLGPVKSNKVRDYMEEAHIFLCTSDKREGWGTVINEALNSGCVCIANKYIGATPFLIENGENGYMYKNFKEMYLITTKIIEDKELQKKIGYNGYKTIEELWNSTVASNNIIKLFKSIIENKEIRIKKGPGSKAYPIFFKKVLTYKNKGI